MKKFEVEIIKEVHYVKTIVVEGKSYEEVEELVNQTIEDENFCVTDEYHTECRVSNINEIINYHQQSNL